MVSKRARETAPFLAMDVLERANAVDDAVHLELGEPDIDPPERAVEAAVDSLHAGGNGYTATAGKPALRRAIADYYDRQYGVDVDPERVVVTPGSSPALLLACLAVLDPGDEAVLTDPYYAPYPNFVRAAEARTRTVGLSVEAGFAPPLSAVARTLEDGPAALLLNSPANPTGAVLTDDDLAELTALADAAGTTVLSDEIYHGLDYDVEAHTLLEHTDEGFVVDGFSKRFGMTGWRLGWVIPPAEYVDPLVRMAQSYFLCAPAFVQDAGVAALASTAHLEAVRETYRRRRDFLVDAVADWGLSLGYTPGGAYYLLVDAGPFPGDAMDAAERLLEETGVATTPGVDFGDATSDYLRLSYATGMDRLREADRRVSAYLDRVDFV
ncbi:MAG: pyridoxal phosphate-dependent aminotransferase [Haloferacaceae archaeon]